MTTMKIDIPDQTRVISRYGVDAQVMIHMEECAELIQAISKMRRATNAGEDGTAARENLVEEIADVLICVKQMQEIYRITDHDIRQMVEKKCKRQEARL